MECIKLGSNNWSPNDNSLKSNFLDTKIPIIYLEKNELSDISLYLIVPENK